MISPLRAVLVAAAGCVGIGVSSLPAEAGVCDLSISRSTCDPASFGGVYYTNALPNGTFTVDPFLQLKAAGTEQGYNTSADLDLTTKKTDYQFNQNGSTHDLELSSIPIVTIGSTEYREFFLSIDEPTDANSLISLDQLQIFMSPTGLQTNYNTSTRTLNGLVAVYDLDAGGTDNYIKLDYQLSAQGHMIAYIPNALFTQSGYQYVYVYSQFGTQAASGAGMEEWWVRTAGSGKSVQLVPEPGLLMLFGMASLFAGKRLRKRLLAR